jgi:hypothetical protein
VQNILSVHGDHLVKTITDVFVCDAAPEGEWSRAAIDLTVAEIRRGSNGILK